MMTNFQIIAEIVAEFRVNKISDIGPKHKKKKGETEDEKTYRLLFENIAPDNDKEKIYEGQAKDTGTFRAFKSRFKHNLLKMLHFIDLSKTRLSPVDKAEIECGRLQLEIMTLVKLGARRPAIELTKQLLHEAEKYELAAFAIYGAGILRKHTAETGEETEMKKYHLKQERWARQQEANENSKALLEQIVVHYGKSIAQQPELAPVALGYANEISENIKKHDSYVMQYHKHKLEAIAYQIDIKYQKSIDVWEDLKNYLKKNKQFAADTRFAEIAVQQMDCYLHLGNFEGGYKCAAECDKYFWARDRNWFIFMECYFLLCMQRGNYGIGGKVIEEATAEKLLETQSGTNRGKWQLFKSYYTYGIGETEGLDTFNLNEFLSRHMDFTHDKRGYNVSFMILNWCMLLRKGDIVKLIGIANSIKEYRLHNLQNDRRTDLFVSMMQKADRFQYDPIELQNETTGFLKEIENEPIIYSANMEGLEVIPFDILWLIALKDMRKWKESGLAGLR